MAGSEVTVEVDGRPLRLTNLDKVLYPETGTTKGEVIDYYTRVAPLLLPHLSGRPVTRIRWPEGTDHEPFFAKHLEAGAPDWIARQPIEHSTGAKDYPLVENLPTLVYLAQVASLELHTPQWRFAGTGDRDLPDRLVLDLDPGPGVGLAECAQVARWCRDILSGVGMAVTPVTSGSKGIHLYAPLDGTRTSEDISAFARELARALEADHPDLVVSTMSKAARPGKVFLDWSQNNGSKTTISPYSLRGRGTPTVAAPRTWAELESANLAHISLTGMLERIDTVGDLLSDLRPTAPPLLASYLAKRDAARTPEPMLPSPIPLRTDEDVLPRFVIQEHHASRLHYDLRLEHDGVLVSWAVPKGVPPTPDRNHLAVMTEPHPLEYLTFAGNIPRGEYGAGSMTIWDTGTFELEKWRDDEVIVTAMGRPDGPLGTVTLVLIRTDGAGEKSTWLLHRKKASSSSPSEQTDPIPSLPPAPMLALASTPALAQAAAQRWSAPWAEFKWDGVRALAHRAGGIVSLRARSGTDITSRYPEVIAALSALPGGDLILDGEIVALDHTGRPSFTLLQNRMHLTSARDIDRERVATPVNYFVFDALYDAGRDLSADPLRTRRQHLDQRLASVVGPMTATPVTDDVAAALNAARELSLEGIVVKDPDARYRPGQRSESWIKVKLTATQEVVIGGIRIGRTRARPIASLLLGIPGPNGLTYVGRVGSGFSERALADVERILTPLTTDKCPFTAVPATDASDARWVSPALVGEVEFAEFTPGGILRHARWRGLRPDLSPEDVESPF